MKLLYLDLARGEYKADFLRSHEVISVNTCIDATVMAHSFRFDALLIAGELENSDLLGFTTSIHTKQPELPVFLLSEWGSEILSALKPLSGKQQIARKPLRLRSSAEQSDKHRSGHPQRVK